MPTLTVDQFYLLEAMALVQARKLGSSKKMWTKIASARLPVRYLTGGYFSTGQLRGQQQACLREE
jgi:hypothetical protein